LKLPTGRGDQHEWGSHTLYDTPTKKPLRRGDNVIVDNVSVHKVAGVREAIEARVAALRYLPPYSLI
jgi:hypothetical protein